MPKMDLRYLIGKALTDDNFKQQLIADPAAAAKREGCTITPAQIEALKGMNPDDWDSIESTIYDDQIATSECHA